MDNRKDINITDVINEEINKSIIKKGSDVHNVVDRFIINKDKTIKEVEDQFVKLCISQGIKYKSKTYYKYQHTFFNGAIIVLGEVPPRWGVALMSQREAVDDYSK